MISSWLKSFFTWLASLFVHEAVEQVKEQINTPNTIENANTPKATAVEFSGDYAEWLRKKQSSGSGQPK